LKLSLDKLKTLNESDEYLTLMDKDLAAIFDYFLEKALTMASFNPMLSDKELQ